MDWRPDFDRHPVFAPLAEAIAPFRHFATWPSIDEWNEAFPDVTSAGGARIRFVPQPPKKRGAARPIEDLYDERIFVRGEVPSRPRSWHDFFNMLCWATFPATKRAINARQRAALRAWIDPAAPRLPAARTKEQDLLAMLDEGGLILACGAGASAIEAALAESEQAPIELAVREGRAHPFVLGHAIYEHFVLTPEREVRALPQIIEIAPDAPIPVVDEALSRTLSDAKALVEERRSAVGLVVAALFS
jgi:hypothetical protein